MYIHRFDTPKSPQPTSTGLNAPPPFGTCQRKPRGRERLDVQYAYASGDWGVGRRDNKNRLLGREFEEKESLLHLHEVLALLDSLC
jgi:hypothetical protein